MPMYFCSVLQVALLDLQSNSKIAALLPYFVYVISGVRARVFIVAVLNILASVLRQKHFLHSFFFKF